MSKVSEVKGPSPTLDKSTERVESSTESSSCSLGQCFLSITLVAFNVAVRLYCALYMIISDCDETFNYWEPLNLIARGFGKQTWEYSPAYAIRSYVYLIPYYIVTFPLRDYDFLASANLPPYAFFYYIRIVALCGFTSFTEYKLFRSVRRNFSPYVGNWFLFFSTVSAGMSHAGVALLPSSFAMNWATLATASVLDVISVENTTSVVCPSVFAIFSFLLGGLVGWPFALALGVPFGLFTMRERYQTVPLVYIVGCCAALLSMIMATIICTDSYLYKRFFLFVPLNIVLYNVFALEGEGPEIFGVEPFSYYILNLLLNFNVVFILGYIGMLVNPIWSYQKMKSLVGVSLPLLVWSVAFGNQPHKEERFLYPIYPFIVLSASVLISDLFAAAKRWIGSKWIIRSTLLLSMFLIGTISMLRILNLVENYSAPLTTATVFHDIASNNTQTGLQNVCVGREWFHFPNSFFLPDNYRLRFVANGFNGLLPGDFQENLSLRDAASFFPKGMNSKNIFASDKVVDFDECDFYVDNSLPTDLEIAEPQIFRKIEDSYQIDKDWDLITCDKMIRPDGEHRGIGRILYIPQFFRQFVAYEVEYLDYCVLQKKQPAV